jgi:hypothetical protein
VGVEAATDSSGKREPVVWSQEGALEQKERVQARKEGTSEAEITRKERWGCMEGVTRERRMPQSRTMRKKQCGA